MMQSEIDRQMALVRTVSEKVHSLTANLDGTDDADLRSALLGQLRQIDSTLTDLSGALVPRGPGSRQLDGSANMPQATANLKAPSEADQSLKDIVGRLRRELEAAKQSQPQTGAATTESHSVESQANFSSPVQEILAARASDDESTSESFDPDQMSSLANGRCLLLEENIPIQPLHMSYDSSPSSEQRPLLGDEAASSTEVLRPARSNESAEWDSPCSMRSERSPSPVSPPMPCDFDAVELLLRSGRAASSSVDCQSLEFAGRSEGFSPQAYHGIIRKAEVQRWAPALYSETSEQDSEVAAGSTGLGHGLISLCTRAPSQHTTETTPVGERTLLESTFGQKPEQLSNFSCNDHSAQRYNNLSYYIAPRMQHGIAETGGQEQNAKGDASILDSPLRNVSVPRSEDTRYCVVQHRSPASDDRSHTRIGHCVTSAEGGWHVRKIPSDKEQEGTHRIPSLTLPVLLTAPVLTNQDESKHNRHPTQSSIRCVLDDPKAADSIGESQWLICQSPVCKNDSVNRMPSIESSMLASASPFTLLDDKRDKIIHSNCYHRYTRVNPFFLKPNLSPLSCAKRADTQLTDFVLLHRSRQAILEQRALARAYDSRQGIRWLFGEMQRVLIDLNSTCTLTTTASVPGSANQRIAVLKRLRDSRPDKTKIEEAIRRIVSRRHVLQPHRFSITQHTYKECVRSHASPHLLRSWVRLSNGVVALPPSTLQIIQLLRCVKCVQVCRDVNRLCCRGHSTSTDLDSYLLRDSGREEGEDREMDGWALGSARDVGGVADYDAISGAKQDVFEHWYVAHCEIGRTRRRNQALLCATNTFACKLSAARMVSIFVCTHTCLRV
jgi:hypothetical protein